MIEKKNFNKNTNKKIMKLTEKDLHYIISESVKRIVNEHTNPFGYNEYEGEDMSYESVYDNAEHALVTGMSMGKYYSSVNELIDELYDSSSFNETDYETVYDACEQAMMDVYEEDMEMTNESVNIINKLVLSEVKNKLNEWQRSGNIPRDGMTGGSWGSSEVHGIYRINIEDLLEKIDDETYNEELYDKLDSISDSLYFNVDADYGYDDSVGMSEGYSNITVDTQPCLNAIQNLSLFRGDEIHDLRNAIEEIAYMLESGNGEDINWN